MASSELASLLDPPRPGWARFLPLGGVGEVGKNMALLECGEDTILIDAGLRFPDPEQVGVDVVLPDIAFLRTRLSRLRGVVLTHGHEDHIGALPFYISELSVPVYGTDVTLGLLRNKLERRGHTGHRDLRVVRPGDAVPLNGIEVEFFNMTHSVPGSCGLAIRTDAGLLVHTGDFKLDQTPVAGPPPDLARLAELGREGIRLLLSDSTNALNPGITPSEVSVAPRLAEVMAESPGRVVVVTFASNLARMRQAIELAGAAGRRCCLVGRSMLRNVATARELGVLTPEPGQLVGPRQLAGIAPRRLCLLATGSQGEPLAALSRIAAGTHPFIGVEPGDTFVLAANPIPGNEATVLRIVNLLVAQGARVLAGSADRVHASGHAAAEELRFVVALSQPEFFVPVHGEPRHLAAHRSLAVTAGVPDERVALVEDGWALEVGSEGMRIAGWVRPAEVEISGDGIPHQVRPPTPPQVVEVAVGPGLHGWRGGPDLVLPDGRVPLDVDHRRWQGALHQRSVERDGLGHLGARIGELAAQELGAERSADVLPVVSLATE